MKVFEGVANTVGFSLTVLSACCWVLYVVGFALQYQSLSDTPSVNSTSAVVSINAALAVPYLFHWLYAVFSLPLYIAALTVFLCGSHAFTSLSLLLLTPLACVCLGGMLQTNTLLYYQYYLLSSNSVSPPPMSVHVQTVGGLGALVTLWAVMCVWTCVLHQRQARVNYQEIN